MIRNLTEILDALPDSAFDCSCPHVQGLGMALLDLGHALEPVEMVQ